MTPARQRHWLKLPAMLIGMAGFALILWAGWIPAKAKLAQFLLQRAWMESQTTGTPVKAWGWADTWPVAKLSIPAIAFEAIILREAGGEGLAFGPVLLNQSASLGEDGLSVISAHRDTHFKPLAQLKPGMKIHIEPLKGPTLTYQVEQMRIAPWDRSGLSKDSFEPTLALTSCWPFEDVTPGPLRFIAEARLLQSLPSTQAAPL
ncbi:class GN sortase [Cohaesibacter sp. CAU 1516]|uniref:class GN sortase n=1 Tax=Cohaesibacter sp. CAU 1516 TaxID=2576038 RepID=UPI00148544FF|nr:class GN sortase [Cohaesibacter sp. CAU 1516]